MSNGEQYMQCLAVDQHDFKKLLEMFGFTKNFKKISTKAVWNKTILRFWHL